MYVQLKFQLDVLLYVFLFLSILALHISGYLQSSSGAQLQRTAIGVCNGFGMLIHWSRYWLGHPYTFSTVRFTSQYLLQWINIPKSLHTPMAESCSCASEDGCKLHPKNVELK
jgi:hypothetical protein